MTEQEYVKCTPFEAAPYLHWPTSERDYKEMCVILDNQMEGDLYVDKEKTQKCKKCKGKGYIYKLEKDKAKNKIIWRSVAHECSCIKDKVDFAEVSGPQYSW